MCHFCFYEQLILDTKKQAKFGQSLLWNVQLTQIVKLLGGQFLFIGQKNNSQYIIANLPMQQQEQINLEKYFKKIPVDKIQTRFIDKENIGRGSGAYVMKSIDKDHKDLKVAIKFYNKNQLHPECLIDVQREVKYLTEMNQSEYAQFFVKLYEALNYVQNGGSLKYCLILQLCNRSLKNLIEDKEQLQKLSFEDKLQICIRIAEGMAGLHNKNIIHRDLKPANILLVTRNGRQMAVIADFGHTRQISVEMTSIRGSPQYINPSLMYKDYGFEWDMYSFGLIALQVMTGRFLWQLLPQQKNSIILFTQRVKIQLTRVKKTLTQNFPELHPQIRKIIESCLNLSNQITAAKLVSSLKKIVSQKQNKTETTTQQQDINSNRKLDKQNQWEQNQSIDHIKSKVSQSSKIKSQNKIDQKVIKCSSLIQSQIKKYNKNDDNEQEIKGVPIKLQHALSKKQQKNASQKQEKQQRIFCSSSSDSFEEKKQLNIKQNKSEKIKQKLLFQKSKVQKKLDQSTAMKMAKLVQIRFQVQENRKNQQKAMQQLAQLRKFKQRIQRYKQIEQSSLKYKQKQKLMLLRLLHLKMSVKNYMDKEKIKYTKKYYQAFIQKIKQLYMPIRDSMDKFTFTNRGRQQIMRQNPNVNILQQQYKHAIDNIENSNIRMFKNMQ